MAPRMLLGRWSPGKSVTKRQLRNSCEATKIIPRPNWLHASHEELLASVGPALEKAGVLVTARLDKAPHYGGRELYQTEARWAVRRANNDAHPGHFSWDAQDGRLRAAFPGPRYAAARAAVEEAVRSAEKHAAINRADIRDQLALAIMDHAPVAPYCTVRHIGPGLWVLGEDGHFFNQIRRFLQLAGHPLLDLSEVEGPDGGLRALVQSSFDDAARRYRARSGWTAIARNSHDELLEALA